MQSESAVSELHVKTEPSWDDVCTNNATSCSAVCIKEEDVCVKEETSDPEDGAGGVSEAAAAAGLYTDHAVKDELLLGPILVEHRGRGVYAQKVQSHQQERNGSPTIFTINKTYQCDHCSYTAARKSTLVSHIKTHTSEKLKCDYCDYSAKSEGLLSRHLRMHLRNIKEPLKIKQHVKCSQCSFISVNKGALLQHERTHSATYKCRHCSYVRKNKSKVEIHEKKHTEKPYKCDVCSFATIYERSLKLHKKRHDSPIQETRRTSKKPCCKPRHRSKLISHKCHLCSYTSFSKADLRRHGLTHTGDKPYKCGKCGYSTVEKRRLRIHETKHKGEKPYKCEYCSYATHDQRCLRIHEKRHAEQTQTVIHKCGKCSYSTTESKRLLIHELIKHSSEKPYKCELCSFATHLETNLRIHVKRHTDYSDCRQKPIYKCSKCSYTCNQKLSVLEHERRHTGERPYKCGHCSFSTSYRRNWRVHEKKHKVMESTTAAAEQHSEACHQSDWDHTYARRDPAPRARGRNVSYYLLGQTVALSVTDIRFNSN
ncbi:zinc finger protein 182-like [Cydia splendana]|uniref:zinc finger protein 182-like n=1 Tax=Cydia splendana TaxID=1100963 RepID=UPI00300C190B